MVEIIVNLIMQHGVTISTIPVILAILCTMLIKNTLNKVEILEKLFNRKYRKIDMLKETVEFCKGKSKYLAGEARNFIETEYFRQMTGIYNECRVYRTALIKFKNKLPYNIKWKNIKNANKFLALNNKNTIVILEPNKIDKIEYWLGWLMFAGLLSVVFASFIILFIAVLSAEIYGQTVLKLALVVVIPAILFFIVMIGRVTDMIAPVRDAEILRNYNFEARLYDKIYPGLILKNGKTKSKILDIKNEKIKFEHGGTKNPLFLSISDIFYVYKLLIKLNKVKTSQLRKFKPKVFDSQQGGHTCNCVFAFMILKRLGLINGNIKGKGKKGAPYYIESQFK